MIAGNLDPGIAVAKLLGTESTFNLESKSPYAIGIGLPAFCFGAAEFETLLVGI